MLEIVSWTSHVLAVFFNSRGGTLQRTFQVLYLLHKVLHSGRHHMTFCCSKQLNHTFLLRSLMQPCRKLVSMINWWFCFMRPHPHCVTACPFVTTGTSYSVQRSPLLSPHCSCLVLILLVSATASN